MSTYRYDWEDPPPPPDTYDRIMWPAEIWPAPEDKGYRSGRGKPFTTGEINDYFHRGGRITYRHPKQDQRDRREAARVGRVDARAGMTKLQHRWVQEFNPDCAVDAARYITDLLPRIKSADRRSYNKWVRIHDAVKAIGLGGICQADYAAEAGIDPGYLSRLLAEACERCPGLDHPLKITNLLNLLWKRRQLSSWRLMPLQRGRGKLWDGPLPIEVEQAEQHYIQFPWDVKLAELHHRAFSPIQSNYCAMIEVLHDEVASVGTQRVEKVHFDNWGYEVDRTDYRARLWRGDHDRWFDAVDAWQRLRQFVGLQNTGPVTAQHVLLLILSAELFFAAEDRLRDLFDRFNDNLRGAIGPLQYHDYCGRECPRYGAPYIERVNICPKGRVKLRPKNPLRRTEKLEQRWAVAVHNHSPHVLNNVNTFLRKLFPEPPANDMGTFGWKAFEARMHEAKWSKGPMCTPRLRMAAQHCAAPVRPTGPRDTALFVPDFSRGPERKLVETKTHTPMLPQTMVEIDQHQTVNRDAFMKLGLGTLKTEAYQRFVSLVGYGETNSQPSNI